MTANSKALSLFFPILTACGLAWSAPALPVSHPAQQGYFIEIIVRTAENFRRAEDVTSFVETAARNQVTAISLLVKQDEDAAVESGRVFYRSGIAPAAPGYARFDVLRTMLDAAHARNIKVRAWIPQFHDQVAAKRHPAWRMMALANGQVVPYQGSRQREYFVNPLHPEVRDYELSIVKEVAGKYPVDGIVLDWLRFDNFNMDLGDFTRREYQSIHKRDPRTLDFSRPGPALEQWNNFRGDGIAAYVRTVRESLSAQLPVGIYILPPEFVEVGQDASKFNRDVNFLSPMCYFGDWGFPTDWFWSSCLATAVEKAGGTEIVPAMGSGYSDAQYREIFMHLRKDFPRIKTLAWFHHGRWTEAMLQRIVRLSAP